MRASTFLPLIGIVIFAYLLSTVDGWKILENFSRVDIYYFALSLAVLGFTVVLKATKWKMIIRPYGNNFPLVDAVKAWLIGYSVGLITPGKVGDFTRSYYLDRGRIGRSLTTVIADRAIDVFVLLLLSIAGLTAFTAYSGSSFLLAAAYALLVLFVAAMLLFSNKRFSMFVARPLYRRFAPRRYRERVKPVYHDFYEGLGMIMKNKRILVASTALTLVIWVISIFYIYLVSVALHMGVPYTFFLMVMPIVSLIVVLPISVSGIGTREASMVFLLSFASVGAELAISLSIMVLFIEYLLGAFGFALLYRNPIRRKK